MAVYDRTQGQVSSSSSNLPALPSVDIGSVLIRSLQTALEGNGGDDSDLPDKIAEGINRSNLIKGQKGGVSKSSNSTSVSKSPIDNLLNAEEKKRTKSYESHLKRQEDAEKKAREERAKRDQTIEKAFDATLKGLSTFAQNPLKGLDNALQGGFKLAFKGLDRAFTALPFFKDKKDGKDGGGKNGGSGDSKNGNVISPAELKATLLDSYTSSKEIAAIANVVGNEANFQKNIAVAIADRHTGDLADEKKKEDRKPKGEKDKEEAKEANIEKKRDTQAGEQLAATKGTNLLMGKIVGGVAALGIVAVFLPIIKGLIGRLVVNISNFFKTLPARVKVAMVNFTTGIQKLLLPLFQKIPHWGSNLSEEEQEAKKITGKEFAKQNKQAKKDAEGALSMMLDEEKQMKALESAGKTDSAEYKQLKRDYAANSKLFNDIKSGTTPEGRRYLELLEKDSRGGETVESLEAGRVAQVQKIWEEQALAMSENGTLTKAQFEYLNKQAGGFSNDFVKDIESRGFAKETRMEQWDRTGTEYKNALVGTVKQTGNDIFGNVSVNEFGPGAKHDVRVNTVVYNQSNPSMGN